MADERLFRRAVGGQDLSPLRRFGSFLARAYNSGLTSPLTDGPSAGGDQSQSRREATDPTSQGPRDFATYGEFWAAQGTTAVAAAGPVFGGRVVVEGETAPALGQASDRDEKGPDLPPTAGDLA
jgi:hypothetical protein